MTYTEFVPKTSRKKPITHLAIVAHKDDGEMVGMQGITSCFKDGGFALIVLTDGGNCPRDGKYKGVSYEDMVEMRTAEQKRAATYGKYEKVFLFDLPSSVIKEKRHEIAEKIAEIIDKETELETVFTHSPFDSHPTHVNATKVAIEGVRLSKNEKKPKSFIGVELWRDLDWLDKDDKVILDISGYEKFAYSLLSNFPSQNQSKSYDKAYCSRIGANATFAESHSNNIFSAVSFGVNLMPLLKNKNLSEFVDEKIEKFKASVMANID